MMKFLNFPVAFPTYKIYKKKILQRSVFVKKRPGGGELGLGGAPAPAPGHGTQIGASQYKIDPHAPNWCIDSLFWCTMHQFGAQLDVSERSLT